MRTVERTAEAEKIWLSFFETKSDEELLAAETEFRDCVVEPPSLALRRDAFQAYLLLWENLMHQEKEKLLATTSAAFGDVIDKQKNEIDKQKADFAEVANFAEALYKEKELYLDGEIKCFRAYMDLQDRYRATHNLAEEALHLAEKSLNRSVGLSLPVFLNAPAPQVIRIETPAVPRSLYCTSSTMPPAAPGLETWTWTNCHW